MTDKEKKEESISLSELDDRLQADKDGTLKQEILDKLKPYQDILKAKIAKGELAPQEFEAATKMVEGLKQAEAIIKGQ